MDERRYEPYVLGSMVDTDGKCGSEPFDGLPGTLERIEFSSLDIHLDEIGRKVWGYIINGHALNYSIPALTEVCTGSAPGGEA